MGERAMTDLRKAAEQALKAMENEQKFNCTDLAGPSEELDKAIETLRAAICEYDEFLLEIHEEFGVK